MPAEAFLVCPNVTEPLVLPDNVVVPCVGCGRSIQHHSVIPQIRTICFDCASAMHDSRISTQH